MPYSQEISNALNGNGPWGSLVVKILIFLVLISTLSFTLSTVPELYAEYSSFFTGIEYFCTILFTIEYMLRLYVSTNPFLHAIQPIFIIDLVSVLPSWLDLFIAGDNLPVFNSLFKYVWN